MSQEIRDLARALRAHADWMGLTGAEELAAGTEHTTPATAVASTTAGGNRSGPPGRADAPPTTDPDRASPAAEYGQAARTRLEEGVAAGRMRLPGQDLGAIRSELGDCQRCRLAPTRTQIVFGAGNASARIVFVGEAPGRDEDLKGEPFVGKAGALLTDIIEKGMKIPRSEVYICNVVKCRPPGNRNPEPEEVAACSPFLEAQIDAIGPEVIVALGKFAAHTLLSTADPISRLRGRWHAYRGTPLMPTFHPAHVLRNPAFKREVWEDIKQVMERLGLARS